MNMSKEFNTFHNQIGSQIEEKQVKDLAPRTIDGGYTIRPVVLTVKIFVYRDGSLFISVDDENHAVRFKKENIQDFFNSRARTLEYALDYVISIVDSIYQAELHSRRSGIAVPDEYVFTVRSGEGLFEHDLTTK